MMKKKTIILTLALTGVLFVPIFYLINKKSTPTTDISAMNKVNEYVTIEGNSAEIIIKGSAFIPSRIKVKKGTKITWINKDTMQHSISPIVGAPGDTIEPGGKFEMTMSSTMTTYYKCSFHPNMFGSIMITD